MARPVQNHSEWHYVIEHLITGDQLEAHVTRLKFYCDASLCVTQELLTHVSSGIGFVVDSLLACRFQDNRWEVHVRWAGFEASDRSWEPAHIVLEDCSSDVETRCFRSS
uniref:Chromo domain-containing protein n=1 Tax=Spongospora subterranea TaxID=70186 RepID=A0A0H5RD01_9EUKA|eukprot:CRZ06394.1 hypothetical protein [Spongospora subterranea]